MLIKKKHTSKLSTTLALYMLLSAAITMVFVLPIIAFISSLELEAVSIAFITNLDALKWFVTIIAYVIFSFILFALIGNKIRYIVNIEERISKIETGDLHTSIPVHGNDELSSLAAHVNTMTNILRERFEIEEQLKQEKSELISALSHDIRTPLSIAISYLDLLTESNVESEEKRQQYIHHIRSKAYLIKELTDELFYHSLSSHSSAPHSFAIVDGRVLFGQLLSEFIFILENENFAVQLDEHMPEAFLIRADINQLLRVLDNLCSNVIKYADFHTPIQLSVKLHENSFELKQINTVRNQQIDSTGHGLGINTCKKIITRHEGMMSTQMVDALFSLHIVLPLYKSEE
ncbi:HAMP domain-containing sensor histidine kinase [Paenibacillus agilis]|uniref:histidine kinase n=1 Tax=Paenibacillus agilis TaxID=3020863 RepID=A0A559J0Q0_9BACL|nr:HAMP domain-containing sensor histidine kinase [Paenibacillus agilis]TVX93468.1 HAMP domain-containing histidine kinase [Paenibacillus agilis]